MEVRAKTLDDLLNKALPRISKNGKVIRSSRGDSVELEGVMLKLSNPRARFSRTEKKGTLFSCLGELLWFLSGSNKLDFIQYYIPKYQKESEDGLTLYGAYGPRIFDQFGTNQIRNIQELLTEKPSSRRAVIQIFDAQDISANRLEIPCTCTLQFLIRDGQLNMHTHMRSNDAFVGLPHDFFTFTMIQEILSRSLGVNLGTYAHSVGSLHIYSDDTENVQAFLNEGWQEETNMPPMPDGDPWPSVQGLLGAEEQIRHGSIPDIDALGLAPYWSDLVRLLVIFRCIKDHDLKRVVLEKNRMSSDVYESYIRTKLAAKLKHEGSFKQLEMLLSDTPASAT